MLSPPRQSISGSEAEGKQQSGGAAGCRQLPAVEIRHTMRAATFLVVVCVDVRFIQIALLKGQVIP